MHMFVCTLEGNRGRQRKSNGTTKKERERERDDRRDGEPAGERVTGSLFPIPTQSKINLSSYS